MAATSQKELALKAKSLCREKSKRLSLQEKAVHERQGGGSIVNLSSIYGLVGRPREIGAGLDPYLHSKGGVAQLTRDMAVHFAREGVRVKALCPGFVYTPLDEVADG